MFPVASRLFNVTKCKGGASIYLHVNYLINLSETHTFCEATSVSLYGTVYKYELGGQHVSDEATAKEDSLCDRLIIAASSLETRFRTRLILEAVRELAWAFIARGDLNPDLGAYKRRNKRWRL